MMNIHQIVLMNASLSLFRQIRLLYGRQIVDGRDHALALHFCSGPAAHYLTRAVSSPMSDLVKEVLACGVWRVACLVSRVSCP